MLIDSVLVNHISLLICFFFWGGGGGGGGGQINIQVMTAIDRSYC